MVKEKLSLLVEETFDTREEKIYVPYFMSLGKKKYLYDGENRIEFGDMVDAMDFIMERVKKHS